MVAGPGIVRVRVPGSRTIRRENGRDPKHRETGPRCAPSQGTDRGQIRGAQTRAWGQGFNIVLTRKSAATVRESDNI